MILVEVKYDPALFKGCGDQNRKLPTYFKKLGRTIRKVVGSNLYVEKNENAQLVQPSEILVNFSESNPPKLMMETEIGSFLIEVFAGDTYCQSTNLSKSVKKMAEKFGFLTGFKATFFVFLGKVASASA